MVLLDRRRDVSHIPLPTTRKHAPSAVAVRNGQPVKARLPPLGEVAGAGEAGEAAGACVVDGAPFELNEGEPWAGWTTIGPSIAEGPM